MTIILDFDDTLFDTVRFKRALAGMFRKHGIDFRKTYEQAKKPEGVYSLKRHSALVKIDKMDLKQFLFPGVVDFLKNLKKDNNLILLSWGDREFQKTKIYGLGKEFVPLFDAIINGPIKKAEVVKKILKSYTSRPVIFVDDKPQEREKIKNKFKDIIVIKNIWQIEKIGQ